MEKVLFVSLDLWGTLIKSHPKYKPARTLVFQDFIRKYGESIFTKDIALCESTIKFVESICDQINTLTHQQFTEEQVICICLAQMGVDINRVQREDMGSLKAELRSIFKIYPPMMLENNCLDIFKSIREMDIGIGLLSNTSFIVGSCIEPFLVERGISKYFDFAIYSDQFGESKPSKNIFNEVSKRSTISVKNILHVGDSADTDGMAGMVGMQVIIKSSRSEPILEKVLNYILTTTRLCQ